MMAERHARIAHQAEAEGYPRMAAKSRPANSTHRGRITRPPSATAAERSRRTAAATNRSPIDEP